MSSVICGSERRPLVARMLGGNASTKTTTSQSLPEFKIFLLARSPMCACGGHVDPHLLVNYLPLLFRLCIQMGLPLTGSPFSYFVLVLHVRGIIFAKDAAAADDPLASDERRDALSKEQKFG